MYNIRKNTVRKYGLKGFGHTTIKFNFAYNYKSKAFEKRFLIKSSKSVILMTMWHPYFVVNSVLSTILADHFPVSHESLQSITQSLQNIFWERDTLEQLRNLTRHCCVCVRKVCGPPSVWALWTSSGSSVGSAKPQMGQGKLTVTKEQQWQDSGLGCGGQVLQWKNPRTTLLGQYSCLIFYLSCTYTLRTAEL